MHRKLKLAPSPTCPCGREEQTVEHVQQSKRRRVACQHFPDDQTLRLQAGAGEDDVFHLPSGLDRVDCERQEEEDQSILLHKACTRQASGRTTMTSKTTKPEHTTTNIKETEALMQICLSPPLASLAERWGVLFHSGSPGFDSSFHRGYFSRSCHTIHLKMGTPVSTPPGAWCYRVDSGAGCPGVSILWQGETESLICNFYLSVAARAIFRADLFLRYTSMLLVGWLVGCLTSQQHASVSPGRICSDNCTCCHSEIELADKTFYLTQSQYADTEPTSPSTDPIMPSAWQGSHWSANI